MKLKKKKLIAQKRRWRIRKKISGTVERPRLSVHFSNHHVYAQCIDDVNGKVISYLSTLNKELRDAKIKPNAEGAKSFGEKFGELTKNAKVNKIVFDRGGRKYHGCVKAFADAVRAAGIEF